MIIDDIIALFFSIFEGLFVFLFEGIALLFASIINIFILFIELIVGLFVTGFSMKKVKPYKRKKKDNDHNEYNHQKDENSSEYGKYVLYIFIGVIVAFLLIKPYISSLSYQDITLVAKDGKSLPFASVVIYRDGAVEHRRTKNDGSLRIKKSGLEKIVINDKRYVETTWLTEDLADILVVKRTILGSGLDVLANKLLKPKN
jgi:hypothetical protein